MQILEQYSKRREQHWQLHQAHERISRRYSFARLLIALTTIVMLFFGLWDLEHIKLWVLGLCGLAVIVFIGVAILHDGVIQKSKRHKLLSQINEEASFRLERKWDVIATTSIPPEIADRQVARDLDLFHIEQNRASLVRLLGRPQTTSGQAVLYEWLLNPADPQTIRDRQAAVQELSPMLDWRQELEFTGRKLLEKPHDPEPFLKWAEGEPWLAKRSWLTWTARVVPIITFILIGLNIAGLLPAITWIATAVASLIFTAAWGGKIRSILGSVDWSSRTFRVYANLFRVVAEASFGSKTLSRLNKTMLAQGLSAYRQMGRLDRINAYAEARYYMIHFLLQAFFFWDFHVLNALELWQTKAGKNARNWLRSLGELEVLHVLAGLQHDHPNWAVPKIHNGGQPRLQAEGIGHPLLHPDNCTLNDVSVGPPGTFLLITGSNMSGKSTLLRALGVNAVLAQAGGPVCAKSFEMSSLVLGSSFRINDVLEDGVSYFMAELLRLKEIVNRARANSENSRRSVLFLLDEILLGTNVFERQEAVRRVIKSLMSLGTIGAIATHDLSLADAEGLSEACRPFYFTESFQESESGSLMTFDYRLRPGVSPTVNAIKLLEIIGLEDSSPS
jgi:ABC-type multidrug transport system fused ATPase/permease subunit